MVARRVIDVDQDRVETSAATALVGLDPHLDRREEVVVTKSASRVGGELSTERYETISMPPDHLGERFDHLEPDHALVGQCRHRGPIPISTRQSDAKSAGRCAAWAASAVASVPESRLFAPDRELIGT